jgi:hypothetical protein
MKTKTPVQALVLVLILSTSSYAQDKEKAMNEPSVTWYGVDFSLARFTNITEDPEIFVKQYFNAINQLVPDEPGKYDIKKYFNKEDANINLDQVTERNGNVDPATLVVSEPYEISPEDVQSVVRSYNTQDPSGLGLVFVAENLNKDDATGSYYVCFFNNGTKDIVDARRITGKAAGFGVRNYWAGSMYNVMKAWLKEK